MVQETVTEPVNRAKEPTNWQDVNWHQAERTVNRLRQRIFRATQAGDWNKVQSLQRLMLRCYSNRLMAVRRTTQVNQGKRTPGVDKVLIKTPEGRGRMVDALSSYQPWKARPARRVYIPKANGKQRPLGIPTITDRCLQAMVKNALEPEWEAQFEASSYGFRPGRGCHDALDRIYSIANVKPNSRKQWVVDADIKGAFDNIDHEYLMHRLHSFPARELVRQWLKAGYVDKGVFYGTDAGTPQGGIVSPLLANIALHGMEQALGIKYRKAGGNITKRALVRYADDFVVFTESQEDAEHVRDVILIPWLAERGLELSPEKTHIVHLTDGFDFLGFNVRHYRSSVKRSGYKLLIKPSKKSLHAMRTRLKAEWTALYGQNARQAVMHLNPIIRGMANYFRRQVASRAFHALDHFQWRRQMRWMARTHPNKSWKWRRRQYWGTLNGQRPQDTWVFGDRQSGKFLLKFHWFPIERHYAVKGAASPDDPTLRDYWAARRRRTLATELPPRLKRLAEIQGGLCLVCGASLQNGEALQVHHLIPRHQGGSDESSNLGLIHYLCHRQAHGNPRVLEMARERKQMLLRCK